MKEGSSLHSNGALPQCLLQKEASFYITLEQKLPPVGGGSLVGKNFKRG